jgi:MFS family permease
MRRLLRQRAFRNLWLATTVSQVGTQVSELAIPLTAILILKSSPFAIGLLNALQFLPILLFSLLAGAVADRVRRRRLCVAADLGRMLLLATVPLASITGRLTLWQLYAVAFGGGALTLLFDVASGSYLPSIVGRADLVRANSALQVTEQGAGVVGPALGGWVIGLLTAPIAVALDAVSYLGSAIFLALIRQSEAVPVLDRAATAPGFLGDIRAGMRAVLASRMLRAMAMTSGLIQLFGRMSMAVLLVYLVRDAGLSAGSIGAALGVGSLGFTVGAVLAERASRWFGLGPTLVLAALVASFGPACYALGPRPLAAVFVALGFFVYGIAGLTWTVNAVSLRQALTPDAMQGRVAATMRMLSWGAIPIGSLIGGVLGNTVGLHETLVIGAAGSIFAVVPVLLSPLRSLEVLPEPAAA